MPVAGWGRLPRRTAAESRPGADADALHLSQPALSHSMQRLEAELGQTLFERTGRRMALNDAGALALEHARRILHDGRIMQDALDDFAQHARVVRVALGPPRANLALGPASPGNPRRDGAVAPENREIAAKNRGCDAGRRAQAPGRGPSASRDLGLCRAARPPASPGGPGGGGFRVTSPIFCTYRAFSVGPRLRPAAPPRFAPSRRAEGLPRARGARRADEAAGRAEPSSATFGYSTAASSSSDPPSSDPSPDDGSAGSENADR